MALRLDGGELDVDGLTAFASLFVSDQGATRFGGHDLDFEVTAGPVHVAGITADTLDETASNASDEEAEHERSMLEFERTLAAFDGEKSGPNNWGVNPDAHLTVVVAHKGKVVKSFAYTTVNETDVRAVVAELCNPGPPRPRLSHGGGHH